MPTLPIFPGNIQHEAMVLDIVGEAFWSSRTYDVYCPRCSRYLQKLIRSYDVALAVALYHRTDYGLPVPKEYAAWYSSHGVDPEA